MLPMWSLAICDLKKCVRNGLSHKYTAHLSTLHFFFASDVYIYIYIICKIAFVLLRSQSKKFNRELNQSPIYTNDRHKTLSILDLMNKELEP